MTVGKSVRLPLLLLFLAALIPFLPALIGGKQLGPTEHIQAMVGGSAPSYGWDVLQADGVLQFWPWRDIVFDAWRQGQMPLVNPYQLAGQPLAGNSQSGAFYPLHILFAFLPGSVPFKMLLLGVLHGFLSGLGVFVWLRRLLVSETGAAVAGVGFAMSQFMIAWAPLASVPTTVAWIPWALAGLVAASGARRVAEVGLAVGMMLLAGHLQFAAYGLMAVVLAGLIGAISDRRVLVGLLGVVVGAVIAWPQVSLVLANSANSHRKNVPSEEGYSAYVAGALKPFEALSVVHPRLLGDPSADNSVLGDSGLPNAYWPMYAKTGSNPAECALWVSPVVLVLALVGVFGRRGRVGDSSSPTDLSGDSPTPQRVGSFGLHAIPAALGLLGLLLAFGTPMNRLLFFYFPGWSATGSPGRSLVLIVLGVCALAGFGFDRLPEKADKKWFGLAAVPVLLLAVGFNGMNYAAVALGVENLDKIVAVCTRTQLPMVAVTALLGAVTLAFMVRQRSLLAVGFAVLLTAAWQFPLSGKPVELPKLDIPTQQRVAFESKAWNIAKTPQAWWPPNLATVARVHDLYGYDSILDGRFVNRLKDASGTEPAPPENGNMMLWRTPRATDNALPAPGLGEKLVKYGSSEATKTTGEGIIYARIFGFKRDANGAYGQGQNRAEILVDAYDQQVIELEPKSEGALVFDRFIDGMTSDTPGCEVSDKDGFRFVQCKEGTTRVVLRYPGPKAIYLGLAALATLASLAVVFRKTK
jgi:hypothetical protein